MWSIYRVQPEALRGTFVHIRGLLKNYHRSVSNIVEASSGDANVGNNQLWYAPLTSITSPP